MRIRQWMVAAGWMSVALFGCQKQGVGLEMGDPASPEEVGITIERVDEIDRGELTGISRDAFFSLYAKNGYLRYRALRIRNDSSTPLYFYPIVSGSPETTVLELHTQLVGIYRREEPRRAELEILPGHCTPYRMSDFQAEFRIVGADLRVGDSVEEVALDLNPQMRPDRGRILLRPAEVAELSYRVRLREASPALPSLRYPSKGNVVMWDSIFAYPSGYSPDLLGPTRYDYLVGWLSRMFYLADWVVYREGSRAQKVYLPNELKKVRSVRHPTSNRNICPGLGVTDPTEVGQRMEGFPEVWVW